MELWWEPLLGRYMGHDSQVHHFCGFSNGSDFRTKYFLDENTMTLTPCAEFGMIMAQTVPFLFFLVMNMCLISHHFPRFHEKSVSAVFTVKMGASAMSVVLLIVMVLTGTFSMYHIKTVVLIEYGIMAVVWTVATVTWALSVHFHSWTRNRGLIISGFFASKCAILICVNRWIMFGIHDIRTILPLCLFTVQMIGSIGGFFEWKLHKKSNTPLPLLEEESESDDYVHLDPDADEGAGVLSKLFFLWTNPLVTKGGKRQLKQLPDVFDLPPSLRVRTIERQLVENSPTFFSDGQHYSIARSLLATFGLQYFSLAILRLASDGFTFAGPVLLHLLVTSLEDPLPRDESFIYAILMIVCSFAAAMFSAHFSYYVQKISLKVRAATVTAIYDKVLRVPLAEMSAYSTGQIMNYISTDVDRIVNFCNSFHAFWSLPVQLVIALYLLHREVGMAFISGVLAAVLLIPINKLIMNSIGKMSEKMMSAKDHRVKMITETMHGIRTVKLSGWEDYFQKRIGELRARELHYLRARKYLDAVCVYLWASAPLLITISILSTYTLVFQEKLTAAKVFTSLALVNILIMPLNAFPWVVNGLIEALVSVKRLEWFFGLKEFDIAEMYSLTDTEDIILSVREGSFFWKTANTSVSGVNFEAKKGEIVGVYGEVGSGKSTLLLGFLGETKILAESIGVRQESVSDGIAYVGQTHWLSRGTVRENILAGRAYDQVFYEQVIQACCLARDINNMPGGDSYEISDNGSTLSGGQRARISLARALYQDNSLYLLDNPFASLDKKVAHTIWTEAIEKMLKARGKLVVVCCHDARMLSSADRVIVLNKSGSVRKQGPPSDVLDQSLLSTVSNVDVDTVVESTEDEDTVVEYVGTQDEERQTGAVRASVYSTYIKAAGSFLSMGIIVALIAMQGSKNVSDWWLSQWTARDGGNQTEWGIEQGEMREYREAETWRELLMGERKTKYLEGAEWDRSIHFLTIYAIIAAANTLFTVIRAFLFAYGGVVAARRLHENLLAKLLKASLSWWDRTPSGRVINRMCSDVYTCDDNLPFQLNILLASLFNLIGTLVITLFGLPILVPVVLVLFVLYFFTQRYYRRTTVELKRLSSLALSPLYSHLSDTVNGLATIRAHRFVDRMFDLLRNRLTSSLRAQFSSLAAGQWLTIRLSMIAVTVVSAVALGAIYQHRIYPVDSGLVGLAITYALSLTSLLNGLLGSFIETEKEMVCVERIEEYSTDVNEEKDEKKATLNLTSRHLQIEFNDVQLRYERGLPLALDGITLRIVPFESVAIIGRTGSGKSSLMQALLRAVSIESGSITINSIDIAQLGLQELRKTFGLVPQHPFLFSGSLWDNLVVDVQEVDRGHVAQVARTAHLDSLLERIGGLDGEISEGGQNLSHGEKQIIGICRVIIQKPLVVLIDEATAHLDSVSHERMIHLLRDQLPNCILVSIVHNLSGIEGYDRVIEMDNGKIIWDGIPQQRHMNVEGGGE